MSSKRRTAFTMVELLTVVMILGLLLALLVSAVQRARESGRRTQCLVKLRQIAAAIQQFETQQRKYPGWRHYPFQAVDSGNGQPITFSTSWFAQLLPTLGRDDIFQAGPPGNWKTPLTYNGIPQGFSPNLHSLAVCPSDLEKMAARNAPLSYVVNGGRRDADATATLPADWPSNGVFLNLVSWRDDPSNPVKTPTCDTSFIEKGDGLANTLLLSENYDAGTWPQIAESRSAFIFYPPGTQGTHRINGPGDGSGAPSFRTARPASYHPGGVNVILAGQNGRFLRQDIDYAIYCALMTPKGETAQEPGTMQPSPPSVTQKLKLPSDL